jgi:flagellar hook-associated protein FlgK
MARAVDFFRENTQLFSDPQNTPEKFNLYGGLIALAKDIEEIKSQLSNIQNDLNWLKNK